MSRITNTFNEQKQFIGRIIAKYIRNPSDVEELVQETFVRAYASELKQEIHEPERFLFRTARNLAINKLRRKENYIVQSSPDIEALEVIEDEEHISPEDRVDSRQRLAVLIEALEEMPSELKETVLLRRVEGATVTKIATRLNLSVSGVEKRLARAMVFMTVFIRSKGLDPADFGERRVRDAVRENSISKTRNE